MRNIASIALATTLAAGAPTAPPAAAAAVGAAERSVEPVILTGADLPSWSRLPAQGAADPYPAGTTEGDRDAHRGTLVVPPDARTGVPVDEIVAFRYEGGRWVEIPVQVDERFPYFLANGNSDFGFYSTVDEELTYEWDEEAWRKTAGTCAAGYPPGEGAPTQDPVTTLDDDDEIAFMASDAGDLAPQGVSGPPGTGSSRQQVAIADPLDPTYAGFVYLFRRSGGSAFDETIGYVRYRRHPNADEYIDRYSLRRDDPEVLGVSNAGYGPNLGGTVCRTAQYEGYPDVPDGEPRSSSDRFPRDGVTVTTDAYRWLASGRWMVRSMQIAKPGEPGVYGPDLIDRWKGRAFQQSPDSTISVVGFEDEQVNWEANAALLGERAGPVRAIREVWGADSGTNVTKTETFYRDAITYRYHVRVHPIPPDGLYTDWDYNAGVAVKYYNALKPEGVDIDGVNDDIGNVDEIGGRPAFFDAPDPTFDLPLALYRWEQVSGRLDYGSLVYIFEMLGPTSAQNPTVVPYYRDDKCLDDGTGDDPVARPWPGEASTDQRVKDGYAQAAGKPYAEVTCDERQGAWGQHGVHYFFTGDTDNAFSPKPVTEIDAQQWQFAVPTEAPASVGEPYANTVRAKLRTRAVEQENVAGPPGPPSHTSFAGVETSRDGDTLTVSGDVAFGGQPQTSVGTDAAGDTAQPYPEQLGYDLVGASIGQPDAATGDLTFRWDLTDLPPTGGLPEAARYLWDFGILRQGETTSFALDGKRTDVLRRQSTETPTFLLQANCAPDANNIIACTDVARLPAVMDGEANSVVVTVPRALLEQHVGASLDGARVIPADIFEGISTAPSAYLSVGGTGDVIDDRWDYDIASAEVDLGIVPAGLTAAYAAPATLDGGAFSGTLDLAGLEGAHDVVVRACFGSACAEARLPLTI